MNETVAFADGSSRGNPGPGGWGVVVATPDGSVVERGGRSPHTTNNRMELVAGIEALRIASRHHAPVSVHTDSRYVLNGITKWVSAWKKNNWITTAKHPVVNKDLWQELSQLNDKLDVTWRHVSGHAGIPGNERADELATGFADAVSPRLYEGPREGYGFGLEVRTAGQRKSSRVRREGKAYSYLSLVGGVLKRHATWAECEDRVKGVRGARFKKALSPEEEKEIARSWNMSLD